MITLSRDLYGLLTPAERKRFALLLVVVLVSSLLEVIGVMAILPFLQLAADPDGADAQAWSQWLYDRSVLPPDQDPLLWSGGAVLVVLVVTNLSVILRVWLRLRYTFQWSHAASVRLLDYYLTQPYAFYLRHNTNDIRTDVLSEVAELVNLVMVPFMEFLSRLVVIGLLLSVLLYVDTWTALVAIGLLGGAYFIIYLVQGEYVRRNAALRMELNRRRYRALNELFSGLKTIRVFSGERFFYDRFRNASRQYTDVQPGIETLAIVPRYVLELIAFGTIVCIILFLIANRGDLLSALPVLGLYTVAGYRLLPGLQVAYANAQKIKRGRPVLDQLREPLANEGSRYGKPTQAPAPLPFRSHVTLHQLRYTYPSEKEPALSGIDLRIERGQTVAFVGSTGSGKTTLVDLLVGLLLPVSGEVRLDDRLLTPLLSERWLRTIAYVPQDVFLFDDTVAANITLGEKIEETNLQRAARSAGIDTFIEQELPLGYDTVIGEAGIRLSGGQKQRLGLARALYRKPQILILDEATSALDNLTEKEIIDGLHDREEELTVVLIAHRLSTVRRADRVFLLEQGRVTSSGTYAELLAESANFRRLVEAG